MIADLANSGAWRRKNPLELIDVQGQSYAAQQTLLDLRRDQFSSTVALYKALGGGLEK